MNLFEGLGKSKSSRIAVIGTGYVGLTTGACLAALGHKVVCADIDKDKIARLEKGIIPIHEEGLSKLVVNGVAAGHLSFVLGAANAVTEAEFVFMCLPTPQGENGAADLSYLLGAATEIGPHLKNGAIVINKSTVPVGSAQLVAAAMANPSVSIASNPEFLRQGTAVADFFKPERIVIGTERADVARKVDNLYARIKAPRVHVNTATAELLKYAANAFLATKISYANSISTVSEALGANAHDVLTGMGQDSRIGAKFLTPGPGWGGSCFPKDTQALLHSSRQAGYDFSILSASIQANEAQIDRIIAAITRMAGGRLTGKTIATWGLTFKAGTDDTRESPAIRIIGRLMAAGATVQAYDPKAKRVPAEITRKRSALAACDGADLLVILTEWPEFTNISLDKVADKLRYPKIVDTRGIIATDKAEDLGIQVWSVSQTAGRRYKAAPIFPMTGGLIQRTHQLILSVPGRIVQELPDRYYSFAMHLRRQGRLLHATHPRTYAEKIQWLKVHGHLENYTNFADKHAVRSFIEQTIGKQYLIPSYGTWDTFDEIPFEDLPNQFVLRATHGHGYQMICTDKSKLDMRATKRLADSWLHQNFYTVEREPQYKYIRPRLTVEKYLQDSREFKIPSFGGRPHFIQELGTTNGVTTEDFYDTKWQHLQITEKGYPNAGHPSDKPKQLTTMIKLARTLSADFPFVRVDFTLAGGKLYFRELAFTPASGIIAYEPAATNLELGALIDLSRFAGH